jgi:hypothetical protein
VSGPRQNASPTGRTYITGASRFSAHVLLLGDYRRNEAGRLRELRSGRREGSAASQSQRVLWAIGAPFGSLLVAACSETSRRCSGQAKMLRSRVSNARRAAGG